MTDFGRIDLGELYEDPINSDRGTLVLRSSSNGWRPDGRDYADRLASCLNLEHSRSRDRAGRRLDYHDGAELMVERWLSKKTQSTRLT